MEKDIEYMSIDESASSETESESETDSKYESAKPNRLVPFIDSCVLVKGDNRFRPALLGNNEKINDNFEKLSMEEYQKHKNETYLKWVDMHKMVFVHDPGTYEKFQIIDNVKELEEFASDLSNRKCIMTNRLRNTRLKKAKANKSSNDANVKDDKVYRLIYGSIGCGRKAMEHKCLINEINVEEIENYVTEYWRKTYDQKCAVLSEEKKKVFRSDLKNHSVAKYENNDFTFLTSMSELKVLLENKPECICAYGQKNGELFRAKQQRQSPDKDKNHRARKRAKQLNDGSISSTLPNKPSNAVVISPQAKSLKLGFMELNRGRNGENLSEEKEEIISTHNLSPVN
jgi:hypothetical protein